MELSNEHTTPGPEYTLVPYSHAHVQYAPSLARSISRLLACCTPFTAALASAMAEGNSSDDRGPAGLGKIRGAMWKYDSSDIKLGCRSKRRDFEYQVELLIDDHEALLILLGSHV